MLFKKEFDIDKEFFEEDDTKRPKKRKLALKVFVAVLFVTFFILCYSAFTFNFNMRFGNLNFAKPDVTLKEAQNFFFEAVKNYDNGEYDKAIENLNKQLEIVDDPDAYNYLAKIYMEKGNNELAIENYKKAVEFKPDFFEPNFELGKFYFSINDYKTASKYLTTASNSQPDNIEALSLTAETYKQTGRADEAITIFEKILEEEPESAIANAKIGEIYFQRLQYKKAIPYLEDSIQTSFEENVAMELAKCYFELNALDSAKNIAEEILAENKDNKQAQSLKRAAEYKMGLSKNEVKEQAPLQKVKKQEPEPLNSKLVAEYIKEIELSIKTNWTPPVGSNLKKASVKFTVNKDGELVSNVLFSSSGMADFDKSALDAIEMSKPFPPLPDALNRDSLDIVFTFDFNVSEP